jgi:aspartyl-tRNA(Asn)/glutamyl-tRNA(Gln) amidotransferase subunit A
MGAANVLELSLADAAALVRDKQVSPVELVEACLRQIESTDDTLRAYITVFKDAVEVAKASEALITAGHQLGPLHGVPIALKDNIATAGSRTTAGSRILADWIPDEDATVVKRLRSSGAILIGKTNMHEFAWGGTSANPHYGFVRNPWDPRRFPAGSSGGSGAAVAARTCYGALGTDTGGSIRLPSAVNGIVGLRPTIGRVSNAGVIPLAWSMDTVGPMTRTVQDCALLLGSIAGHDPADQGTAAVPAVYPKELNANVEGLRIGVIPDYFFRHLQPAVERNVRAALQIYQDLGASIVELEMQHIHGNISAQLTVEACEPSAYHQGWLRERPEDYGEDVRQLLEMGELLFARDYIQAQRYRALLRQEFLSAFKRSVDVFMCPTLPFTATEVGATTVVIENGQEEDMLSAIMQFTGVPSLTGLPSLNVPCGFDESGLPTGMQIIGRPFGEAALLDVGQAFQSATDFHTKCPRFAL